MVYHFVPVSDIPMKVPALAKIPLDRKQMLYKGEELHRLLCWLRQTEKRHEQACWRANLKSPVTGSER